MRRRARVAAAAIAVSLAALTGCSGGSSGGGTAIAAPSARLGTAIDFAVPPDIANIPLTRPDGSSTTLAAYRGQAVMIADYLTLCQDICPLITANSLAIARQLAAAGLTGKAAVLEITIDPQRDTPQRMAAYQRLYGDIPPTFALLRADPADSAALWQHFGVAVHRVKEGTPPDTDWLTGKPLTYDIEHSDALIFLGPDGRERFVVEGGPDTQGKRPPPRLLHTLTAQGRQNLRHPDPVTSWTVGQGLQVFSWLVNRRIGSDRT